MYMYDIFELLLFNFIFNMITGTLPFLRKPLATLDEKFNVDA